MRFQGVLSGEGCFGVGMGNGGRGLSCGLGRGLPWGSGDFAGCEV